MHGDETKSSDESASPPFIHFHDCWVMSRAVADLEKYGSGGKSTDWGHSLYKFVKSKEISFKYV
jgi:hypothetical protein